MAAVDLLDIINEDDEVIGQDTHAGAHAKGLLHRYIHIILQDTQGRIICQQRTADMRYPLTFDASVGEHVDAGETYWDAALRGLGEEMGIPQGIVELTDLGRIENRINPAVENMLGRLYVGVYGGPVTIQETEIARVEYFQPAELRAMMERYPYLICDNFKSAIELFMKERA